MWGTHLTNIWRGLVICELRTGELVICELIVRTTDANLGYNANQKVRAFYALKRGPYTCLGKTQYRNDFHNDSKRRKKPTQCTFTKIPQNYTCPLRRQLSALYWAYVSDISVTETITETEIIDPALKETETMLIYENRNNIKISPVRALTVDF